MRTGWMAVLVVSLVACGSDPEPDPGGPDAAVDPDAEVPQGDLLEAVMPGASLDGFTVHDFADLQNDPRAGDPSYAYLDFGEDAVRVPGPTFDVSEEDAATLLVVDDPRVEPYQWGDEAWEDGVRVYVNDRLHFDMKIEDYEYEISALAMVELRHLPGSVNAALIMLGNGSNGVAHRIVTTVVIDGTAGESRGTYTIEMRGNPEGAP